VKKEKQPKNFLEKAYYEGGSKALSAFIGEHLKYPKEAQQHQISGTVVVRYTINYKGKVIETKVVSGIGYGCDEEAQRVVRLLQFKVGSYRNIKIQFHKTIKIHFRKEKLKAAVNKTKPPKQPKTKGMNVQYSITPSQPKQVDQKGHKKTQSYSYTVTIPKKN